MAFDFTGSARLCLTFDDNYVDSWYETRALFDKHNARATFFVCWPERLSEEEVRKLHVLQDEGHEIGFHTREHVRLPKYLETHTLEEYLADQIDAGLEVIHRHGFDPRSFSFPYFRYRPKLIDPMLERFDILRLDGPTKNYHDALTPHEGVQTVKTLAFTDKTGLDLATSYFTDRFEWLAQNGGIGVTCGHYVGHGGNKFPRVRCTPEALDQILHLAQGYGFSFMTMAEIAHGADELAIAA
ncbi:polysaccharide deacetylase family protein [Roseobacteraceae bacterium S113]